VRCHTEAVGFRIVVGAIVQTGWCGMLLVGVSNKSACQFWSRTDSLPARIASRGAPSRALSVVVLDVPSSEPCPTHRPDSSRRNISTLNVFVDSVPAIVHTPRRSFGIRGRGPTVGKRFVAISPK
jgi:hypothetical protein